MTDQGIHFINDAIKYRTNHFIMKHTSNNVYYPQGNGQAKSINKIFGTLLTKLVNGNRNDCDEHLSIILFSYQTTYKVGIGHTLFQLMYGLHPLLVIEYPLPSKLGEKKNPQPLKILTSRLSKLKKLHENGLISHV
jgi:hypothetical protein